MPGSTEKFFADDHPTAAGHFPGNPIIPGALLLDTILLAIGDHSPAMPHCEVRATKFLRPVRPGDRIRIEWHEERGETHFKCVFVPTGETALMGTLRLSDNPG